MTLPKTRKKEPSYSFVICSEEGRGGISSLGSCGADCSVAGGFSAKMPEEAQHIRKKTNHLLHIFLSIPIFSIFC